MKKTNAARILDNLQINYSLAEYLVDEEDLSADHVAKQLGIAIEKVYKTLVLTGDKTGIIIACIPGNSELDLKAIATISGNKKCAMLPLRDVQKITGYLRGGCSPVGMKKSFPTFIDSSTLNHEKIHVSAGVRGLQFLISPTDLQKATDGKLGELCLMITDSNSI